MSVDRQAGFYDEKAETMSADELRAFQESFLQLLVPYCFERSSTYREKMESAGLTPDDVKTLDDLPKIPVTRKHETQDLRFEGIQTVSYHEARRIFVSPGPQFYAYGPIPQEANPLLKVYYAIGFRPGDVVINTFSYHFTPAGVNFDDSLGAFGCAVVPAGPGQTELQVEVLSKLAVTGYVGTPSFLKIIAAKARAMGIDPKVDFQLEVALTSAEPLPALLRKELEETYCMIVRQLYGSADGLLPCFECWAADGMHIPEMMMLEITDPATGEPLPPGEPGAITASVFNPYRPLLRFCNGDRGVLDTEPCVCGRIAQRLRFAGRIDEAAKVRGMFVYPEQIAEALERFNIEQWQAIVEHDADGLDVFRVEVVGDLDTAAAAEALRQTVRLRADVERVDAVAEPGRLLDRRTS